MKSNLYVTLTYRAIYSELMTLCLAVLYINPFNLIQMGPYLFLLNSLDPSLLTYINSNIDFFEGYRLKCFIHGTKSYISITVSDPLNNDCLKTCFLSDQMLSNSILDKGYGPLAIRYKTSLKM